MHRKTTVYILFMSGATGCLFQTNSSKGRSAAQSHLPLISTSLAAKREFSEHHHGSEADHSQLRHDSPLFAEPPAGASGYRIEAQGAGYCLRYRLRTRAAEFDKTLRDYAQNADILICDAQYTPRSTKGIADGVTAHGKTASTSPATLWLIILCCSTMTRCTMTRP